ncbi:unnamed protein product [Chrysoparadoxa australica]
MLKPERKRPEAVQGLEGEGPRKVARTHLDLENVQSSSESQMWLVKVPPSVYNAWQEQAEDTEVGELAVRRNHEGNESLEIKMDGRITKVSGGRKVALPDYSLQGQKAVVDSVVFSQSDAGLTQGGGAKIQARIVRSYTMQPQVGGGYRSLVRQRLAGATLKQSYVKGVDQAAVQASHTGGAKRGMAFEADLQERQAAKLANMGDGTGKRERLEPSVLRSRLFHMFSQEARWTFKDLNGLLNQPDEHLKSVIKEICEMHRTGPYRNQYELKAEYRTG